ncbi:MAG: caspase family protein [Verrucomicrobiaceae bacterium]|nr:caspase family protein [Verrucomicrobiaceae bacterium]
MKTVFLLLSLGLLVATTLSAASDKVALVIGNNTYPTEGELVTPLENCVRDAGLITTTLEKIGFSVTQVTEASRAKIEDALITFQNAIPKGGTALIYFAGHGIEVDGQSYVLGTNARLKARSLLSEEGMKAETMAQFMVDSGAKSSFLFLDCCREAPPTEWLTRGAKKRGLADTRVDGDIIIAFAAKPGQSAQDAPLVTGAGVITSNSPYAQALAKWLPLGLKHTDFFQKVRTEVYALTSGKQRTWENGSFLEDYVFGEVLAAPPPQPVHVANMVRTGPALPSIPTPGSEKRIFPHLILPILEAKCNRCHNVEKSKGDLRMDTYEMVLKGGENTGKTVIPGKPSESLAIIRAELPEDDDEHMPPSGKEQLTPYELALLKWWVLAGAPDETPIEDSSIPVDLKATANAILATPVLRPTE